MSSIKTAVRIFAALFIALFGTLQLSMTMQAAVPANAWIRRICHAHPVIPPVLSFATLLAVTLLVLSHRRAAWRMPLAVILLLGYGIYGIVAALEYQAWWLALAPMLALAAAVGVSLRARWGAILTCAISALLALYWLWGIITVARNGTLASRPLLFGALMLVPGAAMLLLAGFCCYASSRVSRTAPGG